MDHRGTGEPSPWTCELDGEAPYDALFLDSRTPLPAIASFSSPLLPESTKTVRAPQWYTAPDRTVSSSGSPRRARSAQLRDNQATIGDTKPRRSIDAHTHIPRLALAGLVATTGWAQGLPTTAPSAVGLSEERLDRLEAVVQRYVDEQAIAGAVTLVARRGRQAHLQAYGMADRNDGTPMTADTIFRIASMTKPVTSVAVLMLYEEGHFKLNDPVGQFLPELASLDVLTATADGTAFTRTAAQQPMTIRHLLTHTSGIGYRFLGDLGGGAKLRRLAELYGQAGIGDGLAEHDGTIEELVTALGTLPLLHEPGAAFSYGLSDDVLGRLVEVVSGVSFDEFLRTRLFEPLGMDDTSF